ncbi:selenium metabolism-associated LysR family transcriptional regulator [Pseudodesulfovibrio piezophilus]|uniref:Transcriptional regulator, LysR family n=1 Tax=Pseudodesulfovibrio piezophilus (strain DSM 21447 / JCM 15486 / C1TLV30) TaxID=1322246 RepID=M1WUC7_PSEP2|nr:selenium metabolism-associated LysR family transcriptional regulator [Pseudodesulfovibrio piezophilus]CCH50557.1 Transcriptional regulator, LysR family [Pseudodesulfovibrio piezophilus C1TLV30]
MDVRKLDAFCKVYELQNFSKAGEVMYLSQPTISSHVANLEEELGVRLFDRLGRKVLPTQAGHVLYERAVAVFENLDQAKASIEMLRDKVVGELTIGCSTIPSHHILPGYLAKFSAKYPQVSFHVHTSDSSEIIRRVANGEYPVGLVGQKPEEEGLEALEIMGDEIVVVAANNASWLPQGNGSVPIEDVASLPWVMREKGSATRRVLESALETVGLSLLSLNVRCWVEGTCEAIAHTLSGVGVSVTSRLATEEYLKSGAMKQLDVPQLAGKRKFYLIYHRDRHMFPALQTFVDFVQSL